MNKQLEAKQETVSIKHISTESFERALRLINPLADDNDDESVIEEFLNLGTSDITKTFVHPFNVELNQNLLKTETEQRKKDLISYYIMKLGELQDFFLDYHKILFGCTITYGFPSSGEIEYMNKAGEKSQLDKYERYVVYSYAYFNEKLRDIKSACIVFSIDFNEISKRLEFDAGLFNDDTDTFSTDREKKFLIKTTQDIQPQQTEISIGQRAKPPQTHQYTLAQIALIYIYERKNILDPRTDPHREANSIATSYGFKSPTSGQQLYEKFRLYDSSGNNQRTGATNKNKIIKDIETILPGLKKDAQDMANNELVKLRKSEIEKSEMED